MTMLTATGWRYSRHGRTTGRRGVTHDRADALEPDVATGLALDLPGEDRLGVLRTDS